MNSQEMHSTLLHLGLIILSEYSTVIFQASKT